MLFGTGDRLALSPEVNRASPGSYQRLSMFTWPLAGSVQPDWNPRLPVRVFALVSVPHGS